MLFNDADRTRIAAAIAAAEANTSGEIVVIINTRPHRYAATMLASAVLAAFTLPFLAVLAGWTPSLLFPDWDAIDAATREAHGIEGFAAVQAMLFVAVLALVGWLRLDRVLTPSGLRRDRVHHAAMMQFRARGLTSTLGRTGVLLYLDEPEHVAEVIADEAVFTRIAADEWGETIAALVAGIKSGRAADGLVTAIERAGAVLAAHLPPLPDDVNELPDGLIEL
ncbi:TPM domain-containing protein [Sandarakinorhabdus oryzae]|uniref:TPM domain-containing protein n=1 Tax=Sandarakinorhabdus oryzae TaxID=2675220 RepID=UPI0012E1DBBF|nr:TPM domain-containing protein [Sandarakinorhabdus oryzae]